MADNPDWFKPDSFREALSDYMRLMPTKARDYVENLFRDVDDKRLYEYLSKLSIDAKRHAWALGPYWWLLIDMFALNGWVEYDAQQVI